MKDKLVLHALLSVVAPFILLTLWYAREFDFVGISPIEAMILGPFAFAVIIINKISLRKISKPTLLEKRIYTGGIIINFIPVGITLLYILAYVFVFFFFGPDGF